MLVLGNTARNQPDLELSLSRGRYEEEPISGRQVRSGLCLHRVDVLGLCSGAVLHNLFYPSHRVVLGALLEFGLWECDHGDR